MGLHSDHWKNKPSDGSSYVTFLQLCRSITFSTHSSLYCLNANHHFTRTAVAFELNMSGLNVSIVFHCDRLYEIPGDIFVWAFHEFQGEPHRLLPNAGGWGCRWWWWGRWQNWFLISRTGRAAKTNHSEGGGRNQVLAFHGLARIYGLINVPSGPGLLCSQAGRDVAAPLGCSVKSTGAEPGHTARMCQCNI